jgi:hypothetical protein
VKTADGGGGGGGEGRTAAEAETARTPTGIQNTLQPVDTLLVLKTISHGPGRPARASADKIFLDADQRVILSELAGGVRWRDGRHLAVLTTRVGRVDALPNDTGGPRVEVALRG